MVEVRIFGCWGGWYWWCRLGVECVGGVGVELWGFG